LERRRLWAPGKQAGEGEPSSCGIRKLAEAQSPVCQLGTGKGRARGDEGHGEGTGMGKGWAWGDEGHGEGTGMGKGWACGDNGHGEGTGLGK